MRIVVYFYPGSEIVGENNHPSGAVELAGRFTGGESKLDGENWLVCDVFRTLLAVILVNKLVFSDLVTCSAQWSLGGQWGLYGFKYTLPEMSALTKMTSFTCQDLGWKLGEKGLLTLNRSFTKTSQI